MAVEIALVRRMADVDRGEWDALVGPDGSPFLEWDWLDALEQSGCVSARTGWAPHHLTVRENGQLIAAAPTYLKGHSQGEFVFDHTWAEAAERAGLTYYPKLLVAVPLAPEPLVRQIGMVYRKDKALSRAALGFIDAVLEHVGGGGEPARRPAARG
jgi:predicted N-acyltransferase